MVLRCVVIVGCLLAYGRLSLQAQESPEGERLYRDGPLTADDFQAAVPDPLPKRDGTTLVAYTSTMLRHAYRYNSQSFRRNARATLTEITFTATLTRDESWNSEPENTALLDHEQGHFDITEIFARRAQRQFDQLLKQDTLKVLRDDERAARDALTALIQKRFDVLLADWLDEQKRYDAETRNGLDPVTQSQWRRKLNDELQPVNETRNR